MIELLLVAEGFLAEGDLERAHHLFAQVAEADPRNAIAVVGLARVARRRGLHAHALAEARRALLIDPDEAAAQRLITELTRETTVGADLAGPGASERAPASESEPEAAPESKAAPESEPEPEAAPESEPPPEPPPEPAPEPAPEPEPGNAPPAAIARRPLLDRILALFGLRR
ncbi:MAG: tetratricopeptide repeat protein [Chloroflexi bacterium]|nr:tetratricopeptide repeat protein [Chloroflexota bacterium]